MEDLLDTIHRIRGAWTAETSQLPEQWTKDRPSTGQCCVTSFILQTIYGGDLVRGVTSKGIVHYWNVIDGTTIDATRDQFDFDETFSEIQVNPQQELYVFSEFVTKAVTLAVRAGLEL